MQSTQFGTDHERYLGSGIVDLSELPSASAEELIIHAKELKELKNKFASGIYKPWLKGSRLKAEISNCQWEDKEIGEWLKLGEYKFPKLSFRRYAGIRIIESMALLEVVRLSQASPSEQQWVVDFFWNDGSYTSPWAIESSHKALCSFFSDPTKEPEELCLLKDHVRKSAELVRGISGVGVAFRELSRLPSMWITKSFQYLTDVRKCFCDEEVQNYIWAIVHQWREITLQWDDKVVPYISIDFIMKLQSRAPGFSESDRDDVEKLFLNRQIFPRLEDPSLREKVKMAIRRQGPILTLNTFAQDVRFLQSGVREPMTTLLGKMRRKREKVTLRKRTVEKLQAEYRYLGYSSTLPTAFSTEETAIFERCYQHVFLHTIRNASTKTKISVTPSQLSSIVKQEFSFVSANNTSYSSMVSTENIAIKAPTLSDTLEPEDIDIAKRHGIELFQESAATHCLYSQHINSGLVPRGRVSGSFMAQYIVRILLLGEAAYERMQLAPSSSPKPNWQPTHRAAEELPFCDSSRIDFFSFNGSTSAHQPTLKDTQACRLFPPIEKPITGLRNLPSSQRASIEVGPSPVMSSCSSPVSVKRPSSVSTHDCAQQPEEVPKIAKRLRLDYPNDQQRGDAPPMEVFQPISSQAMAKSANTAIPISPSMYSCTTNGHSTNGNIIYSPESSNGGVTWPPMAAYEEWCNLNPERPVYIANAYPRSSGHTNPRHSPAVLSYTYIQNPNHNPEQKVEALSQWSIQLPTAKTGHISVKYKGKKPGMDHVARPTADETANFFASQTVLDEFSTFRYEYGGIKYASDPQQLHSAIVRYGLKEIFINSEKLGSSDPR